MLQILNFVRNKKPKLGKIEQGFVYA